MNQLVEELNILATANGLKVVTFHDDKSRMHKIVGGVSEVCYWPLSAKRSAMWQGAKQGLVNVTPAEAVAMALREPDAAALHPNYKRKKGQPRDKQRLQDYRPTPTAGSTTPPWEA